MRCRSRRPWFVPLLLTACADYERPTRACDRLGLLCVQDGKTLGLGLARSHGATGDLDGDGHRDLVSASDDGLSITWGYTQLREYRLIPGGAAGVGLGDVDGDGDLDVVFATREPASLRVLENRGERALVDGPTLSLPGRAASLWLGRLDADDSLDAIVGGGDRLSVVTDGLTKTATIPAGRELSAVAAGDLDGDGHLDIVAADRGDAAIHVVLAQGGGFAGPRRIATGVAPEYLQLYDLDGDDNLDILTHGEGREIWLHQNTGAGELAAPRGLVVQDDASPGFGAHRDEQGRRWLITADGAHVTASELDETDAVVRRTLAGTYPDIDGLDIDAGAPLTHGQYNGIRLSLEPSHVFTELWHAPADTAVAIAIADVDLDGMLDLVTAERDVVVRRGLTDASWGEPSTLAAEGLTNLAVADVTGDALPDLVLGDAVPSLYIAVGAGDGTFTPGPPVPLSESPVLLYAGLARPGEPAAVAVGGHSSPGVVVLRFDATGALLDQSAPLGVDTARTLTGTDIDDDGDEDLVVLTEAEDATSALVIVPRVDDGWGAARTRPLADLLADVEPQPPAWPPQSPSLVLGDIDLDGRADAVVVATFAVVRLLDFAADAPPPPQVDSVLLAGPRSLALADIDDDDRPDLVLCSGSSVQSVLVPSDGPPQPQAPIVPNIRGCALHVDPDSRRATAALTLHGRGLAVLRPDLAPALGHTDAFVGGPERLHGLATGDLDADGHTDILVGDEASVGIGSATVLWGAADGQPRRATWQQYPSLGLAALAVAPLDDQPGDDVVLAGSTEAQIWTHADGGLRLHSTARPDPEHSGLAVGVQARVDERSDVIVLASHFDLSDLTVYALPRGDDGGFITDGAVVLWTSSGPRTGAMTIADLDGDGFDDAAVLAGGEPNVPWIVTVVWGDRDRSGAATTFAMPWSDARSISSGDLDGDGAPELIFGGPSAVIGYAFAGRDPKALGVLAQGSAETLLVADLEADGHADLLRIAGSNLDMILRSPGDDAVGTLELAAPWTALRAADLDGDEILDLVGLQDGALVIRLSSAAATTE